MVKTYCDVCEKAIIQDTFSRRRGYTKTEFVVDGHTTRVTLCADCCDALMYLLENRTELAMWIDQMRLSNRIRFLFKRPLKEKTE